MPTDSLLEPDEEQRELELSSDMSDELFRATEHPEQTDPGRLVPCEFTGARLFANDRKRYYTIVSLLAEGLPILKIASLLNVSRGTVRAVREREPAVIGHLKERLAGQCLDGAQMCVESILEDLDDDERRKKISARDKSIIAGVLTDKAQLLTGGVTARVEVVPVNPGYEDFNAALEADGSAIREDREAPEQKGAIDVESVDVVPAGGTADAAAPDPGAAEPESAEPSESTPVDSESAANDTEPAESEES